MTRNNPYADLSPYGLRLLWPRVHSPGCTACLWTVTQRIWMILATEGTPLAFRMKSM
jgi:hypothetical protein